MAKSARLLGREIGLSSEEMNQLLFNQGFLIGEPGNYECTNKANPFVNVNEFHRGNGGYARYNKYWQTMSYDESILNHLNLSLEEKNIAREQVRLRRLQQIKIRKEQQALANNYFNEVHKTTITTDNVKISKSKSLPKSVKVAVTMGGIAIACYGIYQIPFVKRFVKNKIVPFLKKNDKTYKSMPCPKCGKHLILIEEQWSCVECDFIIDNKRIVEGEIFCECADCGSLLNAHEGYSSINEIWVCTQCGCENEVPKNLNDK